MLQFLLFPFALGDHSLFALVALLLRLEDVLFALRPHFFLGLSPLLLLLILLPLERIQFRIPLSHPLHDFLLPFAALLVFLLLAAAARLVLLLLRALNMPLPLELCVARVALADRDNDQLLDLALLLTLLTAEIPRIGGREALLGFQPAAGGLLAGLFA
jgi:hypothetical protein